MACTDHLTNAPNPNQKLLNARITLHVAAHPLRHCCVFGLRADRSGHRADGRALT